MKIEDIDIYNLPIWACAIVDEISEKCKKELKNSPEYSRILKESDELLFKYPFISALIDRDEIEEPMKLSVKKQGRSLDSLHWTLTVKIMSGYSFILWGVGIHWKCCCYWRSYRKQRSEL